MKKSFSGLLTMVFVGLSGSFFPARAGWVFISSAPAGKELIETTWTSDMVSGGKYCKIGVRRLCAKSAGHLNGTVVYLPPSLSNAKLYTFSENNDFRLYLAARGYDIYSVDYRTSFVPPEEKDLSFMAEWGTSVFLSDIGHAVKFIKKISGAEKVWLSGHSAGGRFVYLYSAKRWKKDVAGMIVLDGSVWESNAAVEKKNSMDINKVHSALKRGDSPETRAFLSEWGAKPGALYYDADIPRPDQSFNDAVALYYSKGPDAASLEEGFAAVKDYIASRLHNAWGPKKLTNVLEGYSTVDTLLHFIARAMVPYWPLADYLEEEYAGNWDGKTPESAYNIHDDLAGINIPLILFTAENFSSGPGLCFKYLGPAMIKSPDTEIHLLKNFGHLDVLLGEKALEEVYKPLHAWLLKREK